MVKVGLIGIGFMGFTHYQIYKKHPNAKIVALADYNAKKLEGDWSSIGGNIGSSERGKEDLTGIKTYQNPLDLINDPDVELVDICMPTDLHAELAIAALKAGKHVFLEKPMARTGKQADAIAQAAAKSKKYFMVGHCIRFWPEYQVTYEMIKSGKYGKVSEIFLRRVANPPLQSDKNWFMNEKRSGGGMLDLHIHDVDFALYLMGKPKKVWAWAAKGPSKGFDAVHAGYEYPGGVHVNIIGGWAYHAPFPFNMEFCIRTEKATFLYDMASGKPFTVYTDGKEISPKLPTGTGWGRELDYFINCIQKKTKPMIVTAKSSLDSIKMYETELASIKAGKAVAPIK
ncbi:MAG: Gfo/Idh/MocA family oxidoreductase [Phycisphaerae bacterium]